MPRPSLENGPTAIVPIRTPRSLKSQLEACLEVGEDVSKLTRRLWTDEINRRSNSQCTKSAPTALENGAQNRVNRLDR